MTKFEANGLATVDKLYSEYGSRAKELKAQGRKVIGYLSALGPVEILTAAGIVPFRLKGTAGEVITKADVHMETMVCSFVRNVFDSALKGKFNYLDGIVLPHLCDSVDRTYDTWSYNLNLPYSHFLNVPHVIDDPSLEFFKSILRVFISSLEKFTGKNITDESLAKAVDAHNKNRRVMRDLYNLRKSDPPLISGVEMTKVLVSAMSLPVDESTALIESVIKEIKKRDLSGNGKKVRIMLVGAQIDDIALVDIIEKSGAWLVMDDTTIGSKIYWPDVDITADPIQGIAERYLKKLKIATTCAGEVNSHKADLEERFGHLKQHVKDFGVNGVILYIYKYCDPYGFDVPAMKSVLKSSGTSVFYMEDEYSTSSLERLKIRIEAFIEMVQQ